MATSVDDLADLRVVVTGASGGLGRIVAAEFHRVGARVALVSRSEEQLKGLQAELGHDRTLICPADVSSEAGNEAVVSAVRETWGGIDTFVANAGISPVVARPTEMDVDVWRRIIDVNLTGVFLGVRAAIPAMEAGSRVIVTASVLGERPRRGLSAYSASKAGVIGLVKALALDLAPVGICVNAVSPGWFDSPLVEGWKANPELERRILDHVALRRWGASDELAGAYLFLASPSASYLTGSVITVDGGYQCV